jgi:hypothetical protein
MRIWCVHERVFILQYYFASKSFAAACEAFRNGYPVKQVPNKTTIHRLVTKFRDTGRVGVLAFEKVVDLCNICCKASYKSFLTNKY